MATDTAGYTLSELMVTAAAREIADGEVVFVGMRLPLLGFLLAKRTHAPDASEFTSLGLCAIRRRRNRFSRWGIFRIFSEQNGFPTHPM